MGVLSSNIFEQYFPQCSRFPFTNYVVLYLFVDVITKSTIICFVSQLHQKLICSFTIFASLAKNMSFVTNTSFRCLHCYRPPSLARQHQHYVLNYFAWHLVLFDSTKLKGLSPFLPFRTDTCNVSLATFMAVLVDIHDFVAIKLHLRRQL